MGGAVSSIKGSTPKPPDLQAAAQQQTSAGQSGYTSAIGGGGGWVKDPSQPSGWRYEDKLGEASQGIVNNAMTALGKPLDLSNDAVTQSMMASSQKYLDPYFKSQNESLEQRLADQGISAGSKAYENAQRSKSDEQARQINQSMLTGRQQAVNESLAGRQQNMSELSGMLGLEGGRAPSVQSPDMVNAANQNYANQLQAQQNSPFNQMLGAAVPLASAAIMSSDRRLKENIKELGIDINGIPLVSYNYINDPLKIVRKGFIAQDVEKKIPHAVVEIDGIKHVNYTEVFR